MHYTHIIDIPRCILTYPIMFVDNLSRKQYIANNEIMRMHFNGTFCKQNISDTSSQQYS